MASRTPSTIQVGLFRYRQIMDRVDKGDISCPHRAWRCGEVRGPRSSVLVTAVANGRGSKPWQGMIIVNWTMDDAVLHGSQ